jgi:hypothetical protein
VRPRLQGLEDRVAPAAGLAQEAAGVLGQYYQAVGQAYVFKIELAVAAVLVSLEAVQARAEAAAEANSQQASSSTGTSATQGSASTQTGDSGSTNSSGQDKAGKGQADNSPSNGPGGRTVPDLDNVFNRIVANLLANAPSPGVLRSDAGRVLQLIFGGPGPAGTTAPVQVSNTPTLQVGGSGVGPAAPDPGLSQASRLTFPAEAAQALIQFGGGQRSGGIDLTPLAAGGAALLPAFVVGGTGAAPVRPPGAPGNVLEAGPPAADAAAAPEKTEVVPRSVPDVPLKTYLLGPEPKAEPTTALPAEPAAEQDRMPEEVGRSTADADDAEEAAAMAVADAVFADGVEDLVDLPVIDVEVD